MAWYHPLMMPVNQVSSSVHLLQGFYNLRIDKSHHIIFIVVNHLISPAIIIFELLHLHNRVNGNNIIVMYYPLAACVVMDLLGSLKSSRESNLATR